MRSDVYYTKICGNDSKDDIKEKISRLVEEISYLIDINQNDIIALKTSFTDNYDITNIVIDKVLNRAKKDGTDLFITDTQHDNLKSYNGIKNTENTLSHFAKDLTSKTYIANADGINGKNHVMVNIQKKVFNEVKIAGEIHQSDGLIVVNNVKLDKLIGFNGIITSIGYECASKDGKIEINKLAQPVIAKIRCLVCKDCLNFCSQKAISLEDKISIDYSVCIGCNKCISICPAGAINYNRLNYDEYIEGIIEYSYAVLENKKFNKLLYINILKDELNQDEKTLSNNQVIADTTILVSNDPLALDKASYDMLIKRNKLDEYKKLYSRIDNDKQFTISEKLNIGLPNYKLKVIT